MRTILRLLGFIRPFWGEVLLSVVLGTATVACGMGLLGTSAYLIATAALQPSIAVLGVAVVGVRFFGISRGVFRYLERLVSHSSNFRLLAELRVWFYHNIEPLAPARVDTLRGGDLLNRAINDIEVLEDFYVRMVAPPIVAVLITLGTGWFIGRSALLLGWLVVAGLVVGGLVLPAVVYLGVQPLGQKITHARSALTVALVDGIQGMTEWNSYGQEAQQIEKISTAGRTYEQLQAQINLVGAGGGAAGLINQHLWVWLVLVAAIPLVRNGQIDGVALAVIILLTGAAFEAVLPLNQSALLLEGTLQSARRLFEIASLEPAVTDVGGAKPAPDRFHLVISHLSFQYPDNSALVLDDLSLDLPPGKKIALVGPNSAGKSTLINLLLRFWEPNGGAISVDGEDIRSFQIESIRQSIAVIPQSVYLFSGTLDENLRLANPGASPSEIDEAIRKAGLDGLVSRLPKGKLNWVGAQGDQLSGGERQRIAAARAFLKPADLLVMDEPTANLDAISSRDLLADLIQAIGPRSVIWITHDLIGLEAMDEIIVLRVGKVIERGTHADLVKQGGWYAQTLALQRRVFN